MKKTLKLIPAIAMLLISAVMLSTATFAWFSMNSQVTATGMQVKAQAEGGIVISNESKSTWNASATASHTAVAELVPTSTANTTAWYHAVSDDANNARAGQASDKYTPLTPSEVMDGESHTGVFHAQIGSEVKNVYLLNKFYIQSSAEEVDLTGGTPSSLLVNDVTVSGMGTSNALDASLRVAIKVGETLLIYAPVSGATASYVVAGSGSTTTCKTNDKNVATSVTKIPAYTQSGASAIEASVFIYFEGEDPSCKSANIASTLDTLQVTIRFGTTAISTNP